jgi:uncharacterized protein YdeI (BOF family)
VKTRLHSLSSLATLAVLLGLISWGGSLHAQQPSTTPDASQTQQPTPAPPANTQAPDQPAPTPDQTTPSPAAPDQTSPTASQPQAAQDQASGQAFTGTIVKQGDKYMFQDTATGTIYDIDHQDEVKKFEGKKVRVHGTLDPNGKMIRVQ